MTVSSFIFYIKDEEHFYVKKGHFMKKTNRTEKLLREAVEQVVKNKERYVTKTSAFTRNRKLTMKTIIEIILSMEGGTLQKELYDFSKVNHMDIFSSSAFVQQRSKLSSHAFKDIFYQFNNLCNDTKTFKGYRTLAIDGTDIDIFRNPDSECFIATQKFPKGYCKLHVNALYDVLNKTFVDAFLQPRTKSDERLALTEMLKQRTFDQKNLIIADRGYESYNVFAHFINTKNVDFLCRVKQGAGGLRDVIKLPMKELDIDISPEISTTQTNEDKKNNRIFIEVGSKKGKNNSPKTRIGKWDFPSPCVLNLRVVRFEISPGCYQTVITSLSRNEFSIQDIKELYHMRWGIETSFREIKYVMGLVHLHCKKEELVAQEIYSALTMYNYCSRISSSVSIKKRINTVYPYKVNFVMAVYLCRNYFKLHKNSFIQLLDDISRYVEPIRKGRKDERNLRSKFFLGFSYRVAA